jgi:hypothetical protein
MLISTLNPTGILYLARGLPGSGRTTAIERVRKDRSDFVCVDADPRAAAEEFADARAHEASLRRAAELIRTLCVKKIPFIAVETCAPSSRDVGALIEPAKKAGYAVEPLEPAGEAPEDVIVCFERSSHQPTPEFLIDLLSRWEPVKFVEEQGLAAKLEDQAAAWKQFTQAMAAPTYDAARQLLEETFRAHPTAAAALRLDAGPCWGREEIKRAHVFPLAEISPYWAEMRQPRRVGLREPRGPVLETPGMCLR